MGKPFTINLKQAKTWMREYAPHYSIGYKVPIDTLACKPKRLYYVKMAGKVWWGATPTAAMRDAGIYPLVDEIR